MISFDLIPIDVRTPGQYVEFDNSRAISGLVAMPHKILAIGQRLVTGTIAAEIPTRITQGDQAIQSFGRGSMLAGMLVAALNANPSTETWAIALDDDAAGVAAIGSFTFGGPATAAGTVYLYVAGTRIKVGVASGDTGAAIATKAAAAINAEADLCATAAVDGVDTMKVNVTARHKGEAGNSIDLRTNYYQGEALPAGVTVAIAAMADGTGNPDVADTIAAMADEQYNSILMPYTDAANLTALEAELERRWGPMVQIEGHAYAAARGTHAALGTLGDSRNSPHLTIADAHASPTAPWIWAAVMGAVIAFNGTNDPARPFQTLVLTGVMPEAEAERFTREERDLLLHDGISTHLIDAGGRVLIERAITTYKTNAFGLPDASYLDVNTVLTLAYLRFSVRARVSQRYPRHKLADDGTRAGAGQAIVTPKVIRAEMIALFKDWEEAGLAEGIEQFKADLIVERDGTDPNRLNALIPPDVVNQFRVFAGKVQFRL
ncbi:MAG: phage tail sheath C-terminal domain-containing protein [Rhodospirillales bacterium]|jgi:phage tail sheath gpL-like|nr:phage tail sheath C-terminal domain-containing protein [Rhodospirillales bacterium]